jgi:hypothetical protein
MASGGVSERDISEALEALRECSDELAEWVQEHYRVTLHYPSERRRFDRDMEPVLKARAILALYQKAGS